MTDAPRLLTYAECADILRVNPKSVYNFVKRGLLPAARIGHSIRIDAADLAAFVQRSKAAPAKAVANE